MESLVVLLSSFHSTFSSPRHCIHSFTFFILSRHTMMHISSVRTHTQEQELASWSSSLIIRRAAGHGAVKTSLARPPFDIHALFSIVPTTRGTIECLSTCHLHAGLDRSFDLQGSLLSWTISESDARSDLVATQSNWLIDQPHESIRTTTKLYLWFRNM